MSRPLPTICKSVIAAVAVILVLSPMASHVGNGCESTVALPTIRGAFCAIEHMTAPPMFLEGHDAVLPGSVKLVLALIVAFVCTSLLRPSRHDASARSRLRILDPWLPKCRPFARSGYLPFLCAMRDP